MELKINFLALDFTKVCSFAQEINEHKYLVVNDIFIAKSF